VTDVTIERAREDDPREILRNYERFWGDRDVPRKLHHPIFIDEFGDTAYLARRPRPRGAFAPSGEA
jgi:hypothetical protein